MEKIKVLIADDHPLLREGLTKVLSLDAAIEIVGVADNGQTAILQSKKLSPQVILMDINMPVLNGIEATKIIKNEMPEIAILALTVADDHDQVFEVMQSGVNGYVLKDIAPDILIATIKAVHAGETVMHSKVTTQLFNEIKKPKEEIASTEAKTHLTDREIEILKLIAQGINNNDIGNILFISEKTVKNHITSIFKKINVSDRTQAALYAIREKLVDMKS